MALASKAAMFTSNKQDWRTPPELFARLNAEWHFELDAAADHDNALCEHYYTKAENGLLQPWNGRTFCNPPYRETAKWVAKAVEEVRSGRCPVAVLLVAARTDTRWFHQYVWDSKTGWLRPWVERIEFLPGRLSFSGTGRAPFPSMVIVFALQRAGKEA